MTSKTTTNDIEMYEIRDLTYDQARKEIKEYIKNANGRHVYISEIAEQLKIDFELINCVMKNIK